MDSTIQSGGLDEANSKDIKPPDCTVPSGLEHDVSIVSMHFTRAQQKLRTGIKLNVVFGRIHYSVIVQTIPSYLE